MKRIFGLFLVFMAVSAAAAANADRILVKVNDELILESEVEEAVDALSTQLVAAGRAQAKKKLRDEVIKNLVEQKLIIATARQENVAVSDEAVADRANEYINALRARFGSEAEFEEALLKEGMTYPDFRIKIDSQVRNNLIFTKVKQKKQQEFIARAAVADREIERYYNENKDEFKVNDEMNLLQLYVDRSKNTEEPKTIAERIKAEGFEKTAEAVSAGDGIRYVDLGWVDTAQMSRGIRNALANPKKGAVVGPVQTDDAWHIFKIIDFRKGTVRELADVRERVRVKAVSYTHLTLPTKRIV